MLITSKSFGLATLNAGNAQKPVIPQIGLVRSLNVSSYTLLDWQGLNPAYGKINLGTLGSTGTLEAWVVSSIKLSQTPIFVFANPPKWAGPTGSASYIQARAAFISAVVTQFKGSGLMYELQNEVNDQTGINWSGTLQQLIAQCAADYKLIKSIDPNATVLSANFTGMIGVAPASAGGYRINATDFINQGGGATFDVFSIHLYGCTAAEDAYPFILAVKKLTTKPIISTEGNWGYNANLKLPANSQQQADYLVKLIVIAIGLGVPHVWYGLDTDNVTDGGLLNGTALNVPGTAYQGLVSTLMGATTGDLVVSGTSYMLPFKTAAGVSMQIISWPNASASPNLGPAVPTPTTPPTPAPSLPLPFQATVAGVSVTIDTKMVMTITMPLSQSS